jgi:hypothetical protein
MSGKVWHGGGPGASARCTAWAALILATSAGAVTAMTGPRTLSAGEVRKTVAGNTIRYQNDAKDVVDEYYGADGIIHGRSKGGGDYSGVWQIRFGNMLCLVQEDPMQSGCVHVVLRGNQVEFRRRDGVIEGPFELRRGNPDHIGPSR